MASYQATSTLNPLFDPNSKHIDIDYSVQKEVINQPKKDPAGIQDEDLKFLEKIMNLIKENKINLYTPSSLINQAVYESLSDEQKAKVELEAANLLFKLRNMRDLWEAGYGDSFQMNNLVHGVRILKERIEEIRGDVFII